MEKTNYNYTSIKYLLSVPESDQYRLGLEEGNIDGFNPTHYSEYLTRDSLNYYDLKALGYPQAYIDGFEEGVKNGNKTLDHFNWSDDPDGYDNKDFRNDK